MAECPKDEVLTLQFGNFANKVGAQMWNNIHYDTYEHGPQTIQSPFLRYTPSKAGEANVTDPRVITFDKKGAAFNTRPMQPANIAKAVNKVDWNGGVSVHSQQQRGSENVDYEDWGSCLLPQLDQRSRVELPGIFHNDDERPFNVFTNGNEMLHNAQFIDTLENNLHFFLEECDHLQGYQVLVDTDDAFGGLCVEVLDLLIDEHGKKPVVTYATTPLVHESESTSFIEYADRAVLNNALSLQRLYDCSAMYVPLSLRATVRPGRGRTTMRDVQANTTIPQPVTTPLRLNSNYHGSVALGSALRNCMYPLSLEGNKRITFPQMVHGVTGGSSMSKFIGINHCIPWTIRQPDVNMLNGKSGRRGDDHVQTFEAQRRVRMDTAQWMQSYTPEYDASAEDRISREMVVVSHPDSAMAKSLGEPYSDQTSAYYVNERGMVCDDELRITNEWKTHSGEHYRIGSITQLVQTSGIVRYFKCLVDAVSQVPVRQYSEYERSGIGSDEWEEAKEFMLGFEDVYG
eukprot:CFRG4070T1